MRGQKIADKSPALKFPHRVSQGEIETSSHLETTTSTEGGIADGQSLGDGGTAQNWDPQGLPVSPKPLAQPPTLPPQESGQWAGEGGVIL